MRSSMKAGLTRRALTYLVGMALTMCLAPALALAAPGQEAPGAQGQPSNGRNLTANGIDLSRQNDVTKYDLWVCGIQLTSENSSIDSHDSEAVTRGSATYNPDTNVLTLKGFVCSYECGYSNVEGTSPSPPAAIYYSNPQRQLTVVLAEDASTVKTVAANTGATPDPEPTGNQTNTEAGDAPLDNESTTYSYGFYGLGPMDFSGEADLHAEGGAATNSYGICCESSVAFDEAGALHAAGGTATNSYGIYSEGTMAFNATGELFATGGTATNTSIGIYSDSSLTFDSRGPVTAEGGAAASSFGIYGHNTGRDGFGVTVNSGSVTATGGFGPSAFQSCGIVGAAPEGGSAVGIFGGTVNASGGAVSGDATNYSYGIWGAARGPGVGAFVSKDVTQVLAAGHGKAFEGTVTNEIPGEGWSEGAADRAVIPVAENMEWPSFRNVVFGQATDYAAQIKGDATRQFTTLQDAIAASGPDETIELLRNVTVVEELCIKKSIALDLNGYGILQAGGRGNAVIQLSDDSNVRFTLADTDASDKEHYLSINDGRATFVSDTGTESDACIKVIGGFIAGGNGNCGVELGVGDSLTMTGGTIVGNQSPGHGGGVFVCMDSSFTITGGTIANNRSNNKNGVGGVFVQEKGTIAVSGSAVIAGNCKGAGNAATPSNVYLERPEARIAVEGALEDSASIGVTMAFPGVFTASSGGVKASDYLRRFSSDDDTYGVLEDGDELTLGAPHVHSFSYSASGATITATCRNLDGSCYLPNAQISLDLIAPTKRVYGDAGSASATFDADQLAAFNRETNHALAVTDIAYYHNSGMLGHAPTGAGRYVAKFAAGGVIAEADYEIAQRTATLHWENTQFASNGKPQSPTATVSNTLPGDTCTVAIAGARVKPGKYIATAASLSNPNYALPEHASTAYAIKLGTPRVTAIAHTGASAIGVRWSGVPGARYYVLQYRAKNGKWKSAKVKAKSKTLTNMKAGKLYQIRVRAVAKKSKGAWTTTLMRFYPKSQIWAKSRKRGTVTLRWTLIPQANAGYSVTVRSSKNGPIITRKIAKPGALGTTLSGLKGGMKLWVSVRALASTDSGAKLTIRSFDTVRLRVK